MGAIHGPDFFAHLGGQLQHAAGYPRRTRKSADTNQRRNYHRLLCGFPDRVVVFTPRTQKCRPHSRLCGTRLVAQRVDDRHGPVRLAHLVDHHAHQHRLLFRRPLCRRRIMAERSGRKSFPWSTASDLQRRDHRRIRRRPVVGVQLRRPQRQRLCVCGDRRVVGSNPRSNF